MKKWLVLSLLLASSGAWAQTGGGSNSDAERLRISTERSRLEAAQTLEEAACYRRFWVNNCLNEIKARSQEALADLRRQEILLNDEERKTKAAEQLQKIEDKSSPEILQQEAERRAQAVKDFENRMALDRQKAADRDALQAVEQARSDAAAARIRGNQDKTTGRAARQNLEVEERRKYNERVEQAKERQARNAREKASQTKPSAQPLPVPQ